MRTLTLVLLSVLLASSPAAAADVTATANDAWRDEVEARVRTLASGPDGAPVSETVLELALEAAAMELGERVPRDAAAPLVFEAAVRAELRWRFGETLARVRAELRQDFRIAARAGAEAAGRLRTLERVRRRLDREPPGEGAAPAPWWMRPGAARGRWGT